MKSINSLLLEYQDIITYLELEEYNDEIEEKLNINKDELNQKIDDFINLINIYNDNNSHQLNLINKMKDNIIKNDESIAIINDFIIKGLVNYGKLNKSNNYNVKTDFYSVTAVNRKTLNITDIDVLPNKYKKLNIKSFDYDEKMINICDENELPYTISINKLLLNKEHNEFNNIEGVVEVNKLNLLIK